MDRPFVNVCKTIHHKGLKKKGRLTILDLTRKKKEELVTGVWNVISIADPFALHS